MTGSAGDPDDVGRPLSLDLFMRLLKAAQIPQYSPEAVQLITCSLEMRLPPLPPVTERQRGFQSNSPPESATEEVVAHASKVFGRILNRLRREGRTSIGTLAPLSGIPHGELWSIERGQLKPPRGHALLQLIGSLEIPLNSPAAVEVVAAAGVPYLDDDLLGRLSQILRLE